MELFLNDKLGKITIEAGELSSPRATLIIAHGAGAGMHHPFMESLAEAISPHGVNAVRFNFPYMEKGRKAPGSAKDAIATWEKVIAEISSRYPGTSVFVSGKSYGGRMASHLLAEQPETPVKGIIYYGFPLHAPGRDSKDRAAHLPNIPVSQLFIQGTRDKLANFDMITEVVEELPKAELAEIEQGDHSFNTPKSAGIGKDEMMDRLAQISVEWIDKQLG